MTDIVSSTNRPPTMASTISCLVATAITAERAAQRQRAGIAHEDHGRRRVEPQEAEAGADQRAADDGQLARTGDMVDLQVGGELEVADEIGDERRRWRRRSSPARWRGHRDHP